MRLGWRRRSLRLWAVAGGLWASACQFPNYNVGREAVAGSSGATAVAGSGNGGTAEPVSGTSSGGAGATAAGNGATASAGGAVGGGGTNAGGAIAGGGAQASGGADVGGLTGDGGGAGASGDPKLLLEDDFETGADQWLEVAGSPWSVALDAGQAGQGYQLTPAFNDFYASVAKDGPWTDQIIEADVKVLAFGGTGTGDVVSLLGRFANIDNYYAAVLRPDGRAAIRARVAGASPSSIKTSAALGLKVDTWYRLRFELVGSTLRLLIDGQLAAEIEDGNLTRGTVALGGDNTAACFDNVQVTQP
jgi:hypothetical protein